VTGCALRASITPPGIRYFAVAPTRARALLAAGYSLVAVLTLMRGDQVSLRATVSVAAALRTTDDRHETPIFARHDRCQQEARTDAGRPTHTRNRLDEKNACTGSMLHRTA
jgi:hypothetical protein